MGVISRGILGGFSGKVANVVGSSWKGIAVMKSLPLSVANPRTAGQVGQRNKFGGVVGAASALLAPIVKPFFDRFAQRESGYNAFISLNINAWNEGGVVNDIAVKTSKGALVGASGIGATSSAATGDITVSWANNSGEGNALATDELGVTMYNTSTDVWEGFYPVATRADVTAVITPSIAIEASQQLRLYFAFRRADGTIVSDSTNILNVVGA